ncbi:MAG: O-antigen ligase family protein [Alphaproteobacteria bacterium]
MANLIAVAIFLCLGLASAAMFVIYPGQIFVWYLLIKPIVDGFLEQGATIGGATLSFSYLPSLIMPGLFFVLSAFHANRFRHLPFKGLIILYMLLNVGAYFKEGHFDVGTTGFYIRVVFPIFLYFGVPLFVDGREALERLVKLAAISGIFPCAMIFLQKLGFIKFNRDAERLGEEIYERATGGYADSFSVALPIIISMFFLLQIIQSNKDNGKSQIVYEGLLAAYLFSLVFTFHRMTYIVVVIVLAMWVYLNRRINYAFVIGGAAIFFLGTLQAFVPSFLGDIDLFREADPNMYVAPDQGIALEGSALHGRGWLWTMFMNEYFSRPFVDQMFGIRLPGRAPHNDYIRVLFTVGAFGLGVYMLLLTLIGARMLVILRHFTKSGDIFLKNLSQSALFMFVFYMLSGMTLTISTLSTMSWYLWILFGIVAYQHSLYRTQQREVLREAMARG